jgi:hypothetical protein
MLKFRGDMALAIQGDCINCGAPNTVYYARCRDDRRAAILDFLQKGKTDWKGTCEVCWSRGRITNSVPFSRQLSFQQAANELSIIYQGMDIDHEGLKQEVRRQEKNNKIGDDFVAENKAMIDHLNSGKKTLTVR